MAVTDEVCLNCIYAYEDASDTYECRRFPPPSANGNFPDMGDGTTLFCHEFKRLSTDGDGILEGLDFNTTRTFADFA